MKESDREICKVSPVPMQTKELICKLLLRGKLRYAFPRPTVTGLGSNTFDLKSLNCERRSESSFRNVFLFYYLFWMFSFLFYLFGLKGVANEDNFVTVFAERGRKRPPP